MAKRRDKKSQALSRHGALHPRPQDVADELFLSDEFFDARDLVQLKYEMLRRTGVDGHSVSQSAKVFGFSRPTFYEAQAAFNQNGLPGLIPKRPGPKKAHKLTDLVLDFIEEQLATDKELRSPELASRVREQFGLSVHPRSIERALARRSKKGR